MYYPLLGSHIGMLPSDLPKVLTPSKGFPGSTRGFQKDLDRFREFQNGDQNEVT